MQYVQYQLIIHVGIIYMDVYADSVGAYLAMGVLVI